MNKILLLILLFLCSCGRENFGLTNLKIKVPRVKSSSYGYWLHIFNQDTFFYRSQSIDSLSNKDEFEVTLPNSANYVIYAFKYHILANQSFEIDKAYTKNIDLSAGGVKQVNIELRNEGLIQEDYFDKNFTNREAEESKPIVYSKLIFRPCDPSPNSSDDVDDQNCHSDTLTNGSMQSMRITFYKNYDGNPFTDKNILWKSDCTSKEETEAYLDPEVRVPIGATKEEHLHLPFNIKLEFYMDKGCSITFKEQSTGYFDKIITSAERNLYQVVKQDFKSNPETILIFRNEKLGLGEYCYKNYNCNGSYGFFCDSDNKCARREEENK